MTQLHKKALVEIKKAIDSPDHDLFVDEDDVYGEPGCCYLRKTIQSGIYEGQVHVFRIKFNYGTHDEMHTYPRDPPLINFITPMWHTNVNYAGGSICLDVIKSDSWSPIYGLDAIMTSIIALLDDPNVNSPYNVKASQEYKSMRSQLGEYKKICDEYYHTRIQDPAIAKLLKAPEFQTS
jgi:ubiquitin-protein ligase